MHTKLRAFLSPPDLDDRATILNAILLAASTGLGLFFLLGRSAGAILVPNTEITVAALIAVMLVLLLLVRRGQPRLAGVLLLVFGWTALSYQASITGGLRGTAFIANALVILAASLLVGTRTAVVFTLLGIASAWVFAIGESQGALAPYSAPPLLAAAEMTLVLGLVAVLTYLLIRNLARALESARLSNRQLQSLSSNLEHEVAERTHSTEAARAEAEAAKQEMEGRVWLTSRQARLSDCMRGEQDVASLANNVIKRLCHDVGAPLGVLYLLEDDLLQIAGSYGYKAPANGKQQYRLGEGLIGQAALDKQAFTLTNIPDGYLTIESGMGRWPPAAIHAMPFLFDGQPIGVVELAKLNHFDELQEEYLRIATENIAIAFNTARTRTRVNELLTETQAQARALKSQEERLRATNDELEGQTASLRHSESKLRQQQRELEEANAKLESTAAVLRKQQETVDEQNRTLRAARAELEERANQLERANRYKSEFLANMSHELRTPLNSLLILARMLAENREGNLTPGQIESAQIVHDSGQDLLSLINDILDLSKIEAGKMEFQITPVPVRELVQDIQRQFKHVAEEKGLTFTATVAADVPPTVQTDRQRIEQVVRNLLSNAFKFTAQGSVNLVLERPSAGEALPPGVAPGTATVVLRVSDSGIGMTPAQQRIVFEGFQQADGSTSRKYGGTGLGLTISRQLVTHLQGHISLESEKGRGSTFSIYLPVRNKQLATHPARGTGPLPVPQQATYRKTTSGLLPMSDDRQELDPQKQRLLIIEDDVHFARILRDEAHGRGMQCLLSTSGEEGCRLVDTYVPDAVILDLNLPDVSGWDVLTLLKGAESTRHIPVHIISVEDVNMDAFRLGAVGYLTKPVRRDELTDVFDNIAAFIGRATRRLLVVEHEGVARSELAALLTTPSMTVVVAPTGADAVARLANTRFDCVILDSIRPDKGGMEILQAVSAQTREAKSRIIVHAGQELTASESSELMVYADSIVQKEEGSAEILFQETVRFLHHVGASRRDTGPLERTAAAAKRSLRTNGSRPRPGTPPSLNTETPAPQQEHILAVDDDVRSVFALSKLLSNRGLRVSVARSGLRALALLEEHDDIALVLMDIMMPEMDGYEAIKQIRATTDYADVPIIALTANAMTGDEEACIAAGADDYVAKPVRADQLFERIQHWLHAGEEPTLAVNPNGDGHATP